MNETYDLVVLGCGPAGEKAALKAAHYGYKVAVVEGAPRFGGAGTQTGTLPSKTLKETALYLSGLKDQGLFGVERTLEKDLDIADFYYRQTYVSEISSQDIQTNLKDHGVDIYRGRGRFLNQNTVVVEPAPGVSEVIPYKLTGTYILISTGSYPFHPSSIPFNSESVHDSDSILELKTIPKSMVIIGAGVIGCEYATIFAVMGCKVTLVNSADDFLTFIDNEMVAHLKDYMEEHGVEFIMNTRLEKVTLDEPNSLVTAHLSGGKTVESTDLLFAAGRSGRIAGIGLEEIGVKTGPRETILVNEHYQTNYPHIYAVGDVIGFPALASTSMDQGRVAVANMFGLDDLSRVHEQFPYGIYTIPEVSSVGLTEEECKEKDIEYGVGRAYFPQMARARIRGLTKGVLKIIYAKQTQRVLGVHIIGSEASELIHFGVLVVENQMSLRRLMSMVYNCPTLHELYKYAAYDAFGNANNRSMGSGQGGANIL